MANKEVLTVDQLAHLFYARPRREIEMEIMPQASARYHAAKQEAMDAGYSKDAADDIASQEAAKIMNEASQKWFHRWMSQAETAFGRHHLRLVPVSQYGDHKIEPVGGKTWKDAAQSLSVALARERGGLLPREAKAFKRHPKEAVLESLLAIAHPQNY